MKKTAIILTGKSQRHHYFIQLMAQHFDVISCYTFSKAKTYLPDTSKEKKRHGVLNTQAEERVFEDIVLPAQVPIIDVNEYRISDEQKASVMAHMPDVLLVFGSPILDRELVQNFADRIYNIHLGCSPSYRGSATLFWAWKNDDIFAFASTIHLIDTGIDTGDILFWVTPNSVSDGYYMAATRLIKNTIDIFPEIVQAHLAGKLKSRKQTSETVTSTRRSDFEKLAAAELDLFIEKNDFTSSN